MKNKGVLFLLFLFTLVGFLFGKFFPEKETRSSQGEGAPFVINHTPLISGEVQKSIESTGSTKASASCEEIVDSQNIAALLSSGIISPKIQSLTENYLSLRGLPQEKEIDREYNTIKTFAVSADCSDILKVKSDDTYTYNLCEIYKKKDLSTARTFSYNKGDEEMRLTITSLIDRKYVDGAKRNIYDGVTNFDKYTNTLGIDFSRKNQGLPISAIIFLKNQWDSAYLKEIKAQFLNNCKNILNP